MKKRLILTSIAILIISTFILSFSEVYAQNWQDYLKLESNTEQCLAKCEAIFTITNPSPSDIALSSNDVKIWHEVAKGKGLEKEIEIYKEEISTYNVDVPDYGTCYKIREKGTNITSCSEINCQDYDVEHCNCS